MSKTKRATTRTDQDPPPEVDSASVRGRCWLQRLAPLLTRLKVGTLLDIRCSGFAPMDAVVGQFPHPSYFGAAATLVQLAANEASFADKRVRFQALDLRRSRLPEADLLLCRDALASMPVSDVYRALRNIARSSVRLFATTCRVGPGATGPAFDLRAAPFFLPEPLATLGGSGSVAGENDADEFLALWDTTVLRACVSVSPRSARTRGRQTRINATVPAEEIFLLGSTNVSRFLERVAEMGVTEPRRDRAAMAEAWRAAAGVVDLLQASEAGVADNVPVLPIEASMQPHVDALTATEPMRATFSQVPVAFGMVELDRLVVTQHHVDVATLRSASAELPDGLAGLALAKYCMPLSLPPAKFAASFDDGKRFYFHSDSHDCRFLGAQVLDPRQVKGLHVKGNAAAVIALSIGYSTNILNVVRYGNRLVLNNGYHRACTLRARGLTHAPCLIQVCGSWDDLTMVGDFELCSNPNPYLVAARPPILRDFFDRRLTLRRVVRDVLRQIRVTYEVESVQIAAPSR